DLLYTPTFNGAASAVLKKGGKQSSPAEMLEVESFNQRWQPCLKKKDDEIAADKALNEINMKNAEEEEENEVSKLLRGAVEANPNRYTKGSIEHHWATASQTLGIYVTILTEPDTESQLTKLILQSPVGLGCLPHYLEVKPVTVCISEDSLKDKRKKVRGALQQVQTMHLITSEALDKVIPDRPRNRYPGTTRGNCVAWVSLTAPSDHWQMTVEEKSVLYGHHCIGSDAAAADDDKRKGHEIEPAFFNFLPRTFYEDILSTYS
ncbi:unnamed protein product, partial [Durusdinium trenchii]